MWYSSRFLGTKFSFFVTLNWEPSDYKQLLKAHGMDDFLSNINHIKNWDGKWEWYVRHLVKTRNVAVLDVIERYADDIDWQGALNYLMARRHPGHEYMQTYLEGRIRRCRSALVSTARGHGQS